MKELKTNSIYLLFIVIGFILYGNTLTHEYTLDDAIVITENDFTKKGFSGIWNQLSNDQFVGFYGEKKELVAGGRYRPLPMVIYNIQYELFGEKPFVGHLFNVLLYITNGLLLYFILLRLLPPFPNLWRKISFPLLISLLWYFHPIHTEVVANIKGLDEILAFTFQLCTLWFALQFLIHRKNIHLVFIFLSFLLGLLSKESTITWLAIIPLAIYFFRKQSYKEALPIYIILATSSIFWFAIRYQVVGGGIESVADNIMNDPFLEASFSQKYATIMYTLGKYIQLLVFPHPLTYDYYPKHIPIVSWGNTKVVLSVMVYLFLLSVSIWGFFKKHIVSFGILFFLITLSIASNIVFVIGAFMNERFVYVSSLGFCIVLAYFLIKGVHHRGIHSHKAKMLGLGLFGLILTLYSVKTISRNQVWENNLTLATHDANISVNGAKSNVMAGGLLMEKAVGIKQPNEKQHMLQESIIYLQRAIDVHPEYVDALLLMGNAKWHLHGSSKQAMPYYYRILAINPNHTNTWQNVFIILEQEKDIHDKIAAYEKLLQINPNKPQLYLNLGRAFGKEKGDLSMAQQFFERGLQLAPNHVELLTNLGTLYGLTQNFNAAISVLQKAITIQPSVAKTHIDLGLSYYYNGQLEKAKIEFDRAVQLDKSLKRSQFPI